MLADSLVVVGVAGWNWVAPYFGLPALDPLALGLAAAGALLPGIDHAASWVGGRAWMVTRSLAEMIGHRGITHSLVAGFACLVLLHWVGFSRKVIDSLAARRVSVASRG